MIKITFSDEKGAFIKSQSGKESAALALQRTYVSGDKVEIETDLQDLYVSLDQFVYPALVHIPGGKMTFTIPTAPEELMPYAPQAFRGELHTFTATYCPQSLKVQRNLALNPLAQRQFAGHYPFAKANIETRDESVFFARNVIDGCTQNTSHGIWPYQSWGIGMSETAEITIEFGREVCAQYMVLTLRADFPHDAYWRQATATLSDGYEITFNLQKTPQPQRVEFDGLHNITSITLHKLIKQAGDSPFPALTEWEIWGTG